MLRENTAKVTDLGRFERRGELPTASELEHCDCVLQDQDSAISELDK